VPAFIELARLLEVTERILRDEETDEDLQLIVAPGSSLGGARPKASIIDLDEATCSISLLEATSAYFGLGLGAARSIIKEVAAATAAWREIAKSVGARATEIARMASAFEHDDLHRALAL
jgi:uncharacterized protein YdbL (DUF1318 family)